MGPGDIEYPDDYDDLEYSQEYDENPTQTEYEEFWSDPCWEE